MEYKSSAALYDAIESLRKDLTAGGQEGASNLIADGLSGLNGLTDGWAYLLEKLNAVSNTYSAVLTVHQQDSLSQVKKSVNGIVYRK